MEFINLFNSRIINYLLFFNLLILFFLIFFFIKIKIKHSFFLKVSEQLYHKNKIFNNSGVFIILLFLFSGLIIYLYEKEFSNIFVNFSSRYYLLFLAVFLLLILSIYDELFKINPTVRLIFQISICYLSLPIFKFPIIEILPNKVELLFIVYFFILIINTNNFIDGSDGVMGACSTILYVGVLILSYLENQIYPITIVSLIMLSLFIPFLFFNWPKAKIFAGDTGSIPVGFINGYIIVFLIQIDYYFLGVIFFLYPLLDVNLTIIRKIINGIPPWARLFDYYFLAPTYIGEEDHFFVLKKIILIGFVNLLSGFLYIKFPNIFIFLLSLIPNLYLILLFNKFRK